VNLLLDTHVAIWWLADPCRLSASAREAIAQPRNRAFISAASAWEVELKRAKGKLTLPADYWNLWMADGFEELPVRAVHARNSSRLPTHHADPFDRLLLAQAKAEGLVFISRDAWVPHYGVPFLEA
jgi:PIN domain nuclease of toxin-antitoxin system